MPLCYSPVVRKIVPFFLSLGVVLADQITKLLVVANLRPMGAGGARVPLIGEFVGLVRTQNTGVAFSMGANLPELPRRILVIVLPIAVLIGVVVYTLRSERLTRFERWSIALIVGGGVGNLIDRILRPEGVVDFMLVRVYGLFGMDYFGIFNLADACITVGGMLLIIAVLVAGRARGESPAPHDSGRLGEAHSSDAPEDSFDE